MVTLSFVQLIVALVALIITLTSVFLASQNYVDRIKKERFDDGFKQAQEAVRSANLLLPGEQVVGPSKQEALNLELIRRAQSYVCMLAVDGGSWLPLIRQALAEASRRGVRVRVLLLDPHCDVNEYLCSIEKALTPNAQFNTWVLTPEEQADHIIQNRKILGEIASVRYYRSYPIWRGMIVDGKTAVYRIVHIPVYGYNSVGRRSEHPQTVQHFMRFFFEAVWQQSREA